MNRASSSCLRGFGCGSGLLAVVFAIVAVLETTRWCCGRYTTPDGTLFEQAQCAAVHLGGSYVMCYERLPTIVLFWSLTALCCVATVVLCVCGGSACDKGSRMSPAVLRKVQQMNQLQWAHHGSGPPPPACQAAAYQSAAPFHGVGPYASAASYQSAGSYQSTPCAPVPHPAYRHTYPQS